MKLSTTFVIVLMSFGLLACTEPEPEPKPEEETVAQQSPLTVYKSPTCGCCSDWLDHMEKAGFTTDFEHPDNMSAVKAQLGIANEHASCHTGVTASGYVFEGHVPAKTIQRFLADPPEKALGLAVPGMPIGSPGMEMGERFQPYDVLLLKSDGSSEVYQHIAHQEDQY